MPVYRVQGPDGKVYKVEGPEGATADQLGEFILSQNIGAQEPQRPPVDSSVLDPRDVQAQRPQQATGMQKFMASAPGRFMQGGLDVVDAGAQMLSRLGPAGEAERVDAMNKERAGLFDQARKATGFEGMDFARPLGSAALQLAALRGITPAAATMPGKIALGAAQGATFGALQPVEKTEDFAAEKAKQMGLGAATGAVAAPVAEGLARVIKPTVEPAVAALKAAGVRLTPGQLMEGQFGKVGSLFRTAEEKAQSLPIIGSGITAAKERGIADLNRAALNRALAPIGAKLPKGAVGNEAIEKTAETLSSAYDDVLAKIQAVNIDDRIAQDFNKIGRGIANLPKDKLDQFVRVLKTEIVDRAQGRTLTAESLKAAESNLGQLARGYRGANDFDQRMLGEALEQAQGALRGLVQRQSPANAAQLQKINTGWANYLRAQKAATSVAAEGGVFTPAQLHNAVKTLDRSRNKGDFAKGRALMQDLSAPAKSLMTDKTRNSGTADRLMSAGFWGSLFANPVKTTFAAPLVLPPLAAYSRPGVAAAEALLTARPQIADPIAEFVRRNGLALGAPAYPAVQGLLNSQP